MLQITLDTSELTKASRSLMLLTERQLSFAVSSAINTSAKAASDKLKADLKNTSGPIDKGATPWTVGAVYLSRASTMRPTAEVGIDQQRPRAAGRYLLPMIRGTAPRVKASDLKLASLARRAGVPVPQGSILQPTRHVNLTAQGNVRRATFRDVITKWGQPGSKYFSGVAKQTNTVMIWRRFGRKRKDMEPLFVITDPKPQRSTLDIVGMLETTVQQQFNQAMRTSFEAELRRAGFS